MPKSLNELKVSDDGQSAVPGPVNTGQTKRSADKSGGENTSVKQGASTTKTPSQNSPKTSKQSNKGETDVVDQGSTETPVPSTEGDDTSRPADNSKGETSTIEQGSSNIRVPGTKTDMIQSIMSAMSSVKQGDLKRRFPGILKALGEEAGQEKPEIVSEGEQKTLTNYRISHEDVNLSEDLNAMFNGSEASNELIEHATTIFEAAVVQRVNEQLDKIVATVSDDIKEEVETKLEEQEQQINTHLDYVIEKWLSQNELAIESGLRAEIVESFLSGLHNLYAEHYIDVPDEKIDVVEELTREYESTQNELTEAIETIVDLNNEVDTLRFNNICNEISEGLSLSDKERFKALAENITYEDEDQCRKRLGIIMNSYFRENRSELTQDELSESIILSDHEPLDNLTEERNTSKVRDTRVAGAAAAISRTFGGRRKT